VTADVLDQFTRTFPSVDEGRLARAVALVQGNHCERLATLGLWLVRSAEHPNHAYQVDAYSCSCPDFAKRGGMCKHRTARSLFILAERAEAEAALDADAPIGYALTEAAYALLGEVPDLDPDPVAITAADLAHAESWYWASVGEPFEAAPPTPVGTITRLPMPAHLRSLADELFGPDCA
jgi:hypothetical protein